MTKDEEKLLRQGKPYLTFGELPKGVDTVEQGVRWHWDGVPGVTNKRVAIAGPGCEDEREARMLVNLAMNEETPPGSGMRVRDVFGNFNIGIMIAPPSPDGRYVFELVSTQIGSNMFIPKKRND